LEIFRFRFRFWEIGLFLLGKRELTDFFEAGGSFLEGKISVEGKLGGKKKKKGSRAVLSVSFPCTIKQREPSGFAGKGAVGVVVEPEGAGKTPIRSRAGADGFG